jgi:aspartokinase-like uncharacterized kinase
MSDRHRTVVKVGGALLARPGALDGALRAIESAVARGEQVVVVPGGGPFADAVRAVDASIGLDHDAAHWMAVLAMSAYAHLVASRTARARIVETADEVARALHERAIPVLAPYRWLVEEDPLPHTWDVTSDSIAAWLAGRLDAPRLVLVKPVAGEMMALVDRYFDRALPPGVRAIIADEAGLTEALRAG